jgi:hypothetical protein
MRRALLVLPALALTGGLLTGCGDDGGSGGGGGEESGGRTTLEAVELIRSSPTALEEAGTAQLEMRIDAGPATVEAAGQFDFAAQQGAMTMQMPAPLNSEIRSVFDGTTYFMSADAFGPLAGDLGAEWIRVDLEEMAGETGMDLSQLNQGTTNPAEGLEALAAVSEDGLEEVGSEEVRGVDTTHYRAEIDMAAALEQADEQSGGDLIDEETAAQFEQLYGDQPVPVEVWIDDDGLIRRQTLTFEVGGQASTMEMELFDYGEPVDIEVPAVEDSVSITEVLGSIGGG